jgi:ribosomal protein L22
MASVKSSHQEGRVVCALIQSKSVQKEMLLLKNYLTKKSEVLLLRAVRVLFEEVRSRCTPQDLLPSSLQTNTSNVTQTQTLQSSQSPLARENITNYVTFLTLCTLHMRSVPHSPFPILRPTLIFH